MAFSWVLRPLSGISERIVAFFSYKILLFCNTGYWLSSPRHVHGLLFKMIFKVSKPFSCSLQFRLVFPSTTLNDFFLNPISQIDFPTRKLLVIWISIWYWNLSSAENSYEFSSACLPGFGSLLFLFFVWKKGLINTKKVTNPIQEHFDYSQNSVNGVFWGSKFNIS